MTSHASTGFLRNPSRVSSCSPCRAASANSYLAMRDATKMKSCAVARFRPTQALGPVAKVSGLNTGKDERTVREGIERFLPQAVGIVLKPALRPVVLDIVAPVLS
jgi:hypothetical protein